MEEYRRASALGRDGDEKEEGREEGNKERRKEMLHRNGKHVMILVT